MRIRTEKIYLNPFAKLKLFGARKSLESSDSDFLIICAPCRRRGLITTIISGKDTAEFLSFFKKASLHPIWRKSTVRKEIVKKGKDTGLLMPQSFLPKAVHFRCPDQAARATPVIPPKTKLILNPSIRIQNGKAQVRQLFTGVMLDIDLTPAESSQLRSLRSRSVSLGSLDEKTQARFFYLNILLSDDELSKEQERLEESSSEFKRLGVVTLPQFFPRVLADSVNDYSQQRIKQGFVAFGDHRVEKRFCDPSNTVALNLQRRYQKVLTKLVGLPLKPSYTYIYSYSEGAALPRHLDHRGSEYVVSIALTCEDNGKPSKPWPIYFERTRVWSKPKKITLEPGDAVLYRGQQLHHWRKPLGAHKKCVVLVMTYVQQGRGR